MAAPNSCKKAIISRESFVFGSAPPQNLTNDNRNINYRSSFLEIKHYRFHPSVHTNALVFFRQKFFQQTFSEKFYFKRVLRLNSILHYNILQNSDFSYRFIAKTVQGQYKIL